MLLTRIQRVKVAKTLFASFFVLGIFIVIGIQPAQSHEQESLNPQVTEEPNESSLYLPLLTNVYPAVELEKTWSSDENHLEKIAFLPGQTVHLNSSGINLANSTATARFNWSLEGPCGPELLFDGDVDLTFPTWTAYLQMGVPECAGIYTQTLVMSFREKVYTQSSRFVVNQPTVALVSDKPAFDKCSIPTLDEMQTWMDKSPYWTVNVYIGGIHRGCPNYGLDAFWIYEVTQQGWNLIPTWVGPQAPCSSFKYRMSYDPEKAYIEGKIEADSAVLAAEQLGLMGSHLIYYDLEAFSGSSTSCREATKAFMRGWVERLHESGLRSGLYGGACGSHLSDFAKINPMPDNVWIADWTTYPFRYDPEATVWGARCIDDSLWANHQRIKQYSGDHKETWGDVSLTIDSNVVDGEIALVSQGPLPLEQGTSPSLDLQTSTASQIQTFQLLSLDVGWVLSDRRLLITANSGLAWKDRTPSVGAQELSISAVHFIDIHHGWLVARREKSQEFALWSTQDGGESWQEYFLPQMIQELGFEAGIVQIFFVDLENGWLMLQRQTSSNFSLGGLFRTKDGGESWQALSIPIGEPVYFINPNQGWTAGGVLGDELYTTADGGQTWQPQGLTGAERSQPGSFSVSLPAFGDPYHGLITVSYHHPAVPRLELYTSKDLGKTWELTSTLYPEDEQTVHAPVRGSWGDPTTWLLPQSGELVQNQGMKTNIEMQPLALKLEGLEKLKFVSTEIGWAQVQKGTCTGYKPSLLEIQMGIEDTFKCEITSGLLKTIDGGQTWEELILTN